MQELEQLFSGVERLLSRTWSFDQRRAALMTGAPPLPALWSGLAGMGIFAFALPEDLDGLGGDLVDLSPVFRHLGASLVVAPWLQQLLALQAVAQAGSAAQKARWLPGLAGGDTLLGFIEGAPGNSADTPRMRVARHGDGWVVTGHAPFVQHAPVAAGFVIWATRDDGQAPGLFIAQQQDGAGAAGYRCVDGSTAAAVTFNAAPCEPLGGSAMPHGGVYASLLASGTVLLCTEAVGVLDAAVRASVVYLNTRRQFGEPLSANQALRHRAAEMYVALEQVRSAAALAMDALDGADTALRDRHAAQAKLLAGRHGKWITQQAIQLHGGMGMTDECAVGHYYRRMLVIDEMFGNESVQLERLAGAVR